MGKKKFTIKKNIDLEQGIGYHKTYGQGVENMPYTKKKKTFKRRSFFKRKFFPKRKLFKRKKFIRFAKRIKACTEEIKESVVKLTSLTKRLCYTERTATVLEAMRSIWNNITAGVGEGQRIGQEIFVRYITLEFFVNWTATTYSGLPHRVIVCKSKTPQTSFLIGDILDANSVNLNDFHYNTQLYNAGTKVMYSHYVSTPPQYDLEAAEPDLATEKYKYFKKTFRIMKPMRELTTDPAYFNLPFMYVAVLRPPDTAYAGTGPVFDMNIRLTYQDA